MRAPLWSESRCNPKMLKDNSSLSNPDEAKSEHLHLILNVNFDKTIISGSVEFTVVANKGAKSFIVDTKELAISGVKVDGKDATYDLAPKHEIFGSALSIPLPPAVTSAGGKCSIIVNYSTSTASSACQWLPPAQTAGKRYPFLFTQCQAIHARSLFPCQDCPKAKCTWSSEVTAPAWAQVLMSALEQGSPGFPCHSYTPDMPFQYSLGLHVCLSCTQCPPTDLAPQPHFSQRLAHPPPPPLAEPPAAHPTHCAACAVPAGSAARLSKWKQPVPTCSYLVALAVGELSSRDISPRCRVPPRPHPHRALSSGCRRWGEGVEGEGMVCGGVGRRL